MQLGRRPLRPTGLTISLVENRVTLTWNSPKRTPNQWTATRYCAAVHTGFRSSYLMGVGKSLPVVLILALAVACTPAAAPGDSETGGGETPEPTETAAAGDSDTDTVETPDAAPEPTAEVEVTPEKAAVGTSPPGDCWGGLLSKESLHCHVLEEAQRDGEIQVVAMYEAPNAVLHIFLAGSRPLDWDLAGVFEQKAIEFLDGPQGVNHYRDIDERQCTGLSGREWKLCSLGWVDFRGLTDYPPGQLFPPFPLDSDYVQIFLYPGGSEARKSVAGWPAWRQVWPTVDAPRGSDVPLSIDVSDVSTTDIPEPDCDTDPVVYVSCAVWKRVPETRVAGRIGRYFQVKGPLPQDEEELEALKLKLYPPPDDLSFAAAYFCYENFDEDGLCRYTHTDGSTAICREETNMCTAFGDGFTRLLPTEAPPEVVLIPVGHSYGELWRWSVILNRFAHSAGNTIGITLVEPSQNRQVNDDDVLVAAGPGQATLGPDDKVVRSTVRDGIFIEALVPQTVVDALDELLPLLGIPESAIVLVRPKPEAAAEVIPE